MSVDFAGVDVFLEQLQALGEDAAKKATENALKATQAYIAKQAEQAIKKHEPPIGKYGTHTTDKAIITDYPVEWTQTTASIAVGFDLENGGMPSLYLMHGTTVHGQPHITEDAELYDAVYGSKTLREVHKLQKAEFEKIFETWR
jgi:hypothetical protein